MSIQYDYVNQAWVENGRYVDCNHPKSMKCGCYGRVHKGEVAPVANFELPPFDQKEWDELNEFAQDFLFNKDSLIYHGRDQAIEDGEFDDNPGGFGYPHTVPEA